jgi:hypothetical protein
MIVIIHVDYNKNWFFFSDNNIKKLDNNNPLLKNGEKIFERIYQKKNLIKVNLTNQKINTQNDIGIEEKDFIYEIQNLDQDNFFCEKEIIISKKIETVLNGLASIYQL